MTESVHQQGWMNSKDAADGSAFTGSFISDISDHIWMFIPINLVLCCSTTKVPIDSYYNDGEASGATFGPHVLTCVG